MTKVKHSQFVMQAKAGDTTVYFAGPKNLEPSFTDNKAEAEVFDERDNPEIKARFLKAVTTLEFAAVAL